MTNFSVSQNIEPETGLYLCIVHSGHILFFKTVRNLWITPWWISVQLPQNLGQNLNWCLQNFLMEMEGLWKLMRRLLHIFLGRERCVFYSRTALWNLPYFDFNLLLYLHSTNFFTNNEYLENTAHLIEQCPVFIVERIFQLGVSVFSTNRFSERTIFFLFVCFSF